MIERDADGAPVRFYPSFGPVPVTPQRVLCAYYHAARLAWRDNPTVQYLAALHWMNERDYCDAYIKQFPPILSTCTTSTMPEPLDYDRAYREAQP